MRLYVAVNAVIEDALYEGGSGCPYIWSVPPDIVATNIQRMVCSGFSEFLQPVAVGEIIR